MSEEIINNFLKDLEEQFNYYREMWGDPNSDKAINLDQRLNKITNEILSKVNKKYNIKYNLIFYPVIKHKEMCPQEKETPNDLLYGFILKFIDENITISICLNISRKTYIALRPIMPSDQDMEWAKEFIEKDKNL